MARGNNTGCGFKEIDWVAYREFIRKALPDYVSDRELAERSGNALRTVRYWKNNGTGPKVEVICPRIALYHKDEVEKFLERRKTNQCMGNGGLVVAKKTKTKKRKTKC